MRGPNTERRHRWADLDLACRHEDARHRPVFGMRLSTLGEAEFDQVIEGLNEIVAS
jgi:hypothetical protein